MGNRSDISQSWRVENKISCNVAKEYPNSIVEETLVRHGGRKPKHLGHPRSPNREAKGRDDNAEKTKNLRPSKVAESQGQKIG